MPPVKHASSAPGGECTAAALPAAAPTNAPADRSAASRQSMLPSLQEEGGEGRAAWGALQGQPGDALAGYQRKICGGGGVFPTARWAVRALACVLPAGPRLWVADAYG